jgi:hypothetical protein
LRKIITMQTDTRNYLVVLLDEAAAQTFTQFVSATTGFDAGAHALNFELDGSVREGGGYRILTVLSAQDLRKFAQELDFFFGPPALRYNECNIDFEADIIISD